MTGSSTATVARHANMNHPRPRAIVRPLAIAALLACAVTAGRADDPNGLFFKPIPAKTVVLTFDDGCLSSYTHVAPILTNYGFGGTFYITEYGSFTNKNWYMTWAQIKALDAMGLEVGNHTKGHVQLGATGLGGCRSQLLGLEKDALANGVTKPTTLAWPIYSVNTAFYDGLYAKGYWFARGGHERAYRPRMDSPYDVPSFTIRDGSTNSVGTNNFYTALAQAVAGQAVVYCFHGIPDLEHPGVGLDPAVFAVMMKHLKDNHYHVIAMRDLGRYVGRIHASLTNAPVTDCTTTSAVLQATLRCSGLTNTVYACWNTSSGGTNAALWTHTARVGTWTNVNDLKFVFAGGTNAADAGAWINMAPTNISCRATGLVPDTTYYYTFFVSNDWGRVWAPNVLSFRLGAPAVDNGAGATNLAAGVTQLRGTLTQGVADIYLQWGTTDGGTTPARWGHVSLLRSVNPGAFAGAISVSNLYYGVPGYYRCWASNQFGTAWAPATARFTTRKPAAPPPTLVNPSFETPVLPTGTRQARPAGAGWTFIGGNETGIDALSGTWWYPEFVPDGRQAAYIFGYNEQMSISQSLTFAQAGNYSISFQAVGREGAAAQLSVQLDGVDILVIPEGQCPQYSWTNCTTPRLAVAAGAHTLAFVNANKSSRAISIDHVQLGGSGALIALTNAPATGCSDSASAVLHATLAATGSVYQVYAYWGEANGGTTAAAWTHSAFAGACTNAALTNLRYTATGLSTNARYFFTFCATNAAEALWAANVQSFGPAPAQDLH